LPEEAPDVSAVDGIVEAAGRGPEALIPILQAIQERYRYLPEQALRRVCEIGGITPADIAGVSTFYSEFRHRPMGRHVVHVCHGTACHVKGAQQVTDAFVRHLGVPEGDDTDPGRVFTIRKVACLGCCSLAVAVRVDDTIYGHVTPETVPRVVRNVLGREKSGRKAAPPVGVVAGAGEIRICVDSCCAARGSAEVREALEAAVEETGVAAVVRPISCVVVCNETPLVEIAAPGEPVARYARVPPEDAREIVLRHFKPGRLARRASAAASRLVEKVLTDETWEPVTRYSVDMREPRIASFLGPQRHIAMECCGEADPVDLDAYVAGGGFRALEKCLAELSPEGVIEEVRRSGLRGRGGAGFPTGEKWSRVRAAVGGTKYVVVNGDEGDPGAFMDRMLLESFPYRVLEGAAIAAYAVGASEGYVYVRSEYPFAVKRMGEAIRRCEERGFLGHAGLRLGIARGAGAFVCGEETALIESLSGRRGTPRLRPPYPAERGFRGMPTLVNNVETLALVPWIVRNGAAAFAAIGTARSAGTKVFALAGKAARGGLIEVPMGTTIARIVEEIGGGIPGGKSLKAVLIGGPSGGCVPAGLAHTPVDYEALAALGAMMGSGGLIVLDESDCMVDIARYFLEFTQDQSCGKCTFCRIGTRRMLDILNRLTSGEGRPEDIPALEDLARRVGAGSLCGLGRTAPNPVLTTLRYFRDEYEAHARGRCPAGRCRALVRYRITDKCIGCTRCAQRCPSGAIAPVPYERHEIDAAKCIRCGTCVQACTVEAIVVE